MAAKSKKLKDVEDIVNDTIINQPDATETIDQPQSPLEIKDSAGTDFDASTHLTNEDGSPKLTPKGKFRKQRQKKDSMDSGGLSSENIHLSSMISMLFFNFNVGFFESGEMISKPEYKSQFQPIEIKIGKIEYNEQQILTEALSGILDKYNMDEISPEKMLLFFVLSYYGVRFINNDARKMMIKTFKKFTGKEIA